MTTSGTFEPVIVQQFMNWVSYCFKRLNDNDEPLEGDENTMALMKRNAVNFVKGFIKAQYLVRFQLFPPEVVASFVSLIASLALQDLKGDWAKFNMDIFQMASHEEDYDVVETEEIPSFIVLTKFLRNPSQQVRDEVI